MIYHREACRRLPWAICRPLQRSGRARPLPTRSAWATAGRPRQHPLAGGARCARIIERLSAFHSPGRLLEQTGPACRPPSGPDRGDQIAAEPGVASTCGGQARADC